MTKRIPGDCRKRESTCYEDDQGRVLFVHSGISDGREWGTFFLKANGSLKRVKSSKLPMRSDWDVAQHGFVEAGHL